MKTMYNQLTKACGHRVKIKDKRHSTAKTGVLCRRADKDSGFFYLTEDGINSPLYGRFFTDYGTEYVKILN